MSDEPLSDCQIRILQLTENMHRADLSGHEKWLACSELMCMNPAWQLKDLAEHVKSRPVDGDAAAVSVEVHPGGAGSPRCGTYRHLRLLRHLEGGREGTASPACAEAGRGQPRRHRAAGPQGTKRHATTVRLARCKLSLASGVNVTVSGEQLSLDDLIEARAKAQKEAKKARDQSLDVKTFQAVMRDKSKAGS